jgi:hypothetical protein
MTLEANVSGQEMRAIDDLSMVGSSMSYSGPLEISTKTGPEDFNVTIWENRTLNAPLRLMIFPVPVAKFPKEQHQVKISSTYQTGSFIKTVVEEWDYTSTYRGLDDVQSGYITYQDQHRFEVVGNVTVGEEKEIFNRSIYYDQRPRKSATVDRVNGLELYTYTVEAVQDNPDLIVAETEFNVTDYRPRKGIVVNFTATVHNLGDTPLLSVEVELRAAREDDLPMKVNKTTIGEIEGLGSAMVHFNWTAEEIGVWEFKVRVDPYNTINEEREDNNEAILELEVVPDAPRPNLYMEDGDLILEPQSPLQNRTAAQITAVVRNEGPGPAYNVTLDFYLGKPGSGGVQIGWREKIETVPAGQSKSAWITWYANVPGHREIWVHIDRNNTVNETIESDNLFSVSLIIIASPSGGVDLVISHIRAVDEDGDEIEQLPKGDVVKFLVTVTNLGPNNATNVFLSVYYDVEDPAGFIGKVEGVIKVGATGIVVWEVPWIIDADDGTHDIIATVVAIGEVEATFLDNVRTVEFKVGPRTKPDPEILDVTVFPDKNILVPGELIGVSGKVTLRDNGFEVQGAEVTVFFAGTGNRVTVTTNELGRYLAELTVPNKPGNYRLEVDASQGYNEGNNHVSVSVERTDVTNGDNGGGRSDSTWLYFVVILVIVLAVGMPMTYYLLLSKAALKRRIRKVHEEIVEIVEEEKGE